MSIDYAAITERQKGTWSEGDFNVLALAVMAASDAVVAAVDVHGGERVLDIACGSGNAAIAAARRSAEVSGIDYVPALVERAKKRAAAEGTSIDFREGDAQALPFADGSFDVVLSVFGVMFAPDQQKSANEVLRVLRPGGRFAITSWMPEEFGGDLFRAHSKYLPPPAGLLPPVRWGTEAGIGDLFGDRIENVSFERYTFHQYYRSTDHAVETFSKYFGPTCKVLASVEGAKKAEFEADLRGVFERYNRATDGTSKVASTCMRVIASKK